ncbi:MAG: hypothetical protein NXI31_10240 [bacterium]|nr:hypothetical protein [bacterium]
MATIHGLAAFARSGLEGLQVNQRDWSPFVGHFTSFAAMTPLRSAIRRGDTSQQVAELLQTADAESARIATLIVGSQRILARSPSDKDKLPACVCLSECTLPGLLGHCERYGRFGWIFRKNAIYAAGGRPCIYVSEEHYALLASRGRAATTADSDAGTEPAPEQTDWTRLHGLANVYRPPGEGQVQDFTHEREWRVFGDLDLLAVRPEALIAPRGQENVLREHYPETPIVPLDVLHEWGI